MKVTVDANILFAALLRDGITRHLWFRRDLNLFAPGYELEELRKYETELRGKFRGTDAEFTGLQNRVLAPVRFVSDSELAPFIPAAQALISDDKDWLYLACALKEDTIIWSQDRHFREQKRIRVHTTAELMAQIGGLGK